jgi:hypothetical protein
MQLLQPTYKKQKKRTDQLRTKKKLVERKKKLTVSVAKVLSPADTTEGSLTGTASGIGGITWATSIPS